MASKFSYSTAVALLLSTATEVISSPVRHLPISRDTVAVTENVLDLRRIKSSSSLSSIYHKELRRKYGQAPLTSVYLGEEFLTSISFGSETFDVVVDTGSSDTWLVQAGFSCIDPTTYANLTEADCYFGSTYTPEKPLEVIPNENFNIGYADGEFLNGYMAYETVTIAGITVPHQEVALATLAAWYGDGISSGLVGLAYPNITSAYAGTNASADNYNDNLDYNPLFTTMYTRGIVAPVFALAISRDASQSGNGGIISFGGIPSISSVPGGYSSSFASAKIETTLNSGFDDGVQEYTFYTIQVDGIAFASGVGHHSGAFDSETIGLQFIVDSGTTLNYVPTDTADKFNALFSPPAFHLDDDPYTYYVVCNATAPSFDVHISGKTFHTNPADLILDIQEGPDLCLTGVQEGGDVGSATFILGDVFLKNVLAVFDLGAEQLRFAAREFYPS